MTTRFAFYGRVSTEDQQDPQASRNWQLARARALTERHGAVVEEFFDIGQSRSIPWKRRPEAARLLSVLADPARTFDAVVIGEPHRAFYGNQYGLTFPLFEHYQVGLWVPEVGGPIDPASEAHDLVMSVFGGMSKGERNRIKIRVRSAMQAQAQVEGRFLGGRPPYGYRLGDAGPHPNPAKAVDGRRLHRLELDEHAAPVVARIFTDYLRELGLMTIAQRLTDEGVPSPSAADPVRNPHRDGRAWAKSAVRAILTNPRYTGFQVWNRQRKAELLLDVDDVGLGYETRMRWNPQDTWVWSEQPAHPAIVTPDTFARVQELLATRGPETQGRAPVRNRRPYVLRGLIRCGDCGRLMQGNWNSGRPHYRCRYPADYARTSPPTHPPTIYVREDRILPALDGWLATAFEPEQLTATLTALDSAQPDSRSERHESLRRQITDADRKLAQHRAALEAGADPAMIADWSRQVHTQRQAAAAQLDTLTSDPGRGTSPRPTPRLSKAQITALVESLGTLLTVLHQADPADKAQIYKELGLRLTYDRVDNTVLAETRPTTDMCGAMVSEDRHEPNPHVRWRGRSSGLTAPPGTVSRALGRLERAVITGQDGFATASRSRRRSTLTH